MFESDKRYGGNRQTENKKQSRIRGSGMLSGGQFAVLNKI